ncbi:MAG: 3-isopropylmalate dehydratase large subunit [SAR324 cluster bacterium]|nr:3-isopropylmalate dehydratase large subunit [SAR324 cluster bacterium]
MGKTLYQKIWEKHVVEELSDDSALLYIDLQMIHEVTSPQAFEGLRTNNRQVRCPNKNFATMDHSIPTQNRHLPFADRIAQLQVETLAKNCSDFGIKLFDLNSPHQGIVHVIAPEQGLTQPGMTIVCGDSHTSTHGAFGSLAFGIGTSEVEQVLATQSLVQSKARTMKIEFTGSLKEHSYAKDMILKLIGEIGTAGGTNYVLEYTGQAIRELSIEGRMTICNMSIEGGARAGIIAPDEKTFAFLKSRRYSPQGSNWDKALLHWKELVTDKDANFDKVVTIDTSRISPHITWGTTPSQVVEVDGYVPEITDFSGRNQQDACQKALDYMGLKGGEKMKDLMLDRVFIGSCTNARLEDLRIVANIVKGRKVCPKLEAMIVPGSGSIKKMAEKEGLADIFLAAGFEWREAGCSMCLGMNEDILQAGQRCASTSNRNFEGRQGKGGRTHLVSPAVAAASAICGHIASVNDI